jgi:predicted SnoaL-like aldol condensation-catalyzing enzyme
MPTPGDGRRYISFRRAADGILGVGNKAALNLRVVDCRLRVCKSFIQSNRLALCAPICYKRAQHNPMVADGRRAFFTSLLSQNARAGLLQSAITRNQGRQKVLAIH